MQFQMNFKTWYIIPLLFLLGACKNDSRKALAYHDEMMGTVNDIIYSHNHFEARAKAFFDKGINTYDSQAMLTLDTISRKLETLEKVIPYGEGGDSLKMAMQDVGTAYRNVYSVCIRAEVDSSKAIPNSIEGLITLTKIDSMFVSCNKKVKEAEEKLRVARSKYATKHGFRLGNAG